MVEYGRLKDYLDYLADVLNKAVEANQDEMILEARDIYRVVSMKPTLPSCCIAMKRMMRTGDEILEEPKTSSGYGVKLKIRYYLKDRDRRAESYPRGRPGLRKGWHLEHPRRHPKSLDQIMKERFDQAGIKYKQYGRIIKAELKEGNWIILTDICQKETFSTFLLKLMINMDMKACKYTLLTRKKGYIRTWRRLPRAWKNMNQITLLYDNVEGRMHEVK